MMRTILRFLGVTPDGEKTGKREAAWVFTGLTAIETAAAISIGVAMVDALEALLMAQWAASAGLIGAAYKLEHDKHAWAAAQKPPAPESWPQGIVPPGPDWQPGDPVTAGPSDEAMR